MRFHDKKAIYLQIADFFMERVLKGKLKADERIASVRETAAELEVNPNTVMRTYSHLQDKGIVYNKRGIGYFIADTAADSAKVLKRDEFMQEELPHLFKTMDLLGITTDDLKTMYQNLKTSK